MDQSHSQHVRSTLTEMCSLDQSHHLLQTLGSTDDVCTKTAQRDVDGCSFTDNPTMS